MNPNVLSRIEPGSLIRVELPCPARGVTVSAFEVTVMNIDKSGDHPVFTALLSPLSSKWCKLRFDANRRTWNLAFYRRGSTKRMSTIESCRVIPLR